MSIAKPQGFTLPELLITIAVLSILSSVSLPNLTSYLQRSATESDISLIKKLIYHAKSRAIDSGQYVTICVLGSRNKCHKTADWSGTITTFIDQNRNGAIDSGETISLATQIGKHAASIQWRSFNRRGYLEFSPMGLSTSSNGTFTYCPKAHNTARQLVLNRQGRLKIRDIPHTTARC